MVPMESDSVRVVALDLSDAMGQGYTVAAAPRAPFSPSGPRPGRGRPGRAAPATAAAAGEAAPAPGGGGTGCGAVVARDRAPPPGRPERPRFQETFRMSWQPAPVITDAYG